MTPIENRAAIFSALGDPTRLAILSRLGEHGPGSITQLSGGLPVTRQAVSQHLQVLAQAGLVSGRRQGRERIWELEAQGLETARQYLEHVSAAWDLRIERLKRLVEG